MAVAQKKREALEVVVPSCVVCKGVAMAVVVVIVSMVIKVLAETMNGLLVS